MHTSSKSREGGEYSDYARWELRVLSRQFDLALLSLGPARNVRVTETDHGDGFITRESMCTTESPGLWWHSRDERAGLYLARIESGDVPSHPDRRTQSFCELERVQFARFVLLLAAFVIREHVTGDSDSRVALPSEWCDLHLAEGLRSACGVLASNQAMTPAIRRLARAVRAGDVEAAGRGSSGAGNLEIELLVDAGLHWVDAAIEGAALADPRDAGEFSAMRHAVGELLAASLRDPRDDDAVEHQNLSQFVTEFDPNYHRALLRGNCSRWSAEKDAPIERRTKLALASIGLVILPNERGRGSAWRALDAQGLRRIQGVGDLPIDVRALARRVLRFPPAASADKAVRAFWRAFDRHAQSAEDEDLTIRSQSDFPSPEAARPAWVRAGGPRSDWMVSFEGVTKPVRGVVGMRVIAELLGAPNQEFAAEDLDRLVQQVGHAPASRLERDALLVGAGSPDGTGLDSRAVSELKTEHQRLAELPATDERAAGIQAIEAALTAAHTPQGVLRSELEDCRRTRQRVRQKIRRARAVIAEAHEPLAAHLGECLRTSRGFAYEPGEGAPIWLIALDGTA